VKRSTWKTLTRRQFVAAAATTLAAPFVRTAHAAGKLTLALWDHWVPTANNASKALIEEWGEKEKVEVQIDYVTTQGMKLYLTIAAEAQARSGTTSSPCRRGGRRRMPTTSSL
jgi:hypothetical protein